MKNFVIVEYPDGRQYAVRTAAAAKRLHAGATIVGYEDGAPYKGSQPPEGEEASPPNEVTPPTE